MKELTTSDYALIRARERGKTYREIADALGISESAARSRVRRALARWVRHMNRRINESR